MRRWQKVDYTPILIRIYTDVVYIGELSFGQFNILLLIAPAPSAYRDTEQRSFWACPTLSDLNNDTKPFTVVGGFLWTRGSWSPDLMEARFQIHPGILSK